MKRRRMPIKALEQKPSEEPKKETFKKDQGKLRWSLLPTDALEEVVRVLEFGAIKYGPDQWRQLPEFEWSRILNALERHLNKLKRGIDRDDESGLLEAAHMACNALFIVEMMIHRLGKDDRFKYPSKEEK
jgi:hypothetical protein